MALVWKVIAVTPDDAMEGTGNWEPFAIGHDDAGEEVVLCKGLIDEPDEGDEENPSKASEVTGGLGEDW